MQSKFTLLAAAAAVALAGAASEAAARDQIRIVGSSTVYPFATVVAERFGKGSKYKVRIDRLGRRPEAVLRRHR